MPDLLNIFDEYFTSPWEKKPIKLVRKFIYISSNINHIDLCVLDFANNIKIRTFYFAMIVIKIELHFKNKKS